MISMDERWIDLETRMAYQEVAIHDLGLELVEQRKAMERLAGEVARLGALIREMGSSPLGGNDPEPPPPHY